MPYAAENQISLAPIDGGIEISDAQYLQALEGMLDGLVISVANGFFVGPPPEPEPDPEPVYTYAEAITLKFAELDRKRRLVEEGGILFGNVPLKTDRQTAAIITAAYVKAKEDPAFTILNWKFADGVFAPLDAATIIAAGDAITSHVQSAFDREAWVSAQLMALTTVEAVLGFNVEAAWAEDPK